MSVTQVILGLAIVALLASYLLIRHRQRVLNWTRNEDPAPWTGSAIDGTKLRPTIDRVRHDYLAARRSTPGDISHRRRLLALTGQAVGRLAFFRRSRAEEDAYPDTL